MVSVLLTCSSKFFVTWRSPLVVRMLLLLRCLSLFKWCLVLSPVLVFTVLSHVAWLGCLDLHNVLFTTGHHGISPGSLETWRALGSADKVEQIGYHVSRSAVQYVRSFLRFPFSLLFTQRSSLVHSTCLVKPGPLVSLFHLEWFYYAADVPRNGRLLYQTLQQYPLLTQRLLLFSIVMTIAEWLTFWVLLYKVIWNCVLKPVVRLGSIVLFFHLLEFIVPFLGPVFLPAEAVTSCIAVLHSVNSYVLTIMSVALSSVVSGVAPIVFRVSHETTHISVGREGFQWYSSWFEKTNRTEL